MSKARKQRSFRAVAITLCMALVVGLIPGMAFAETDSENSIEISLSEGVSATLNGAELNGAPAGVKFGNEKTIEGTYELEGVTISTAVAFLVAAMSVPTMVSYITTGVTVAISLGASHIYWVKQVAYGEDSQYYYVRTKVRLYRDAAHQKPLNDDWKIVYTKKSKNNGASIIGDSI